MMVLEGSGRFCANGSGREDGFKRKELKLPEGSGRLWRRKLLILEGCYCMRLLLIPPEVLWFHLYFLGQSYHGCTMVIPYLLSCRLWIMQCQRASATSWGDSAFGEQLTSMQA